MNTIRKVQIATLIALCASAGAILALNQPTGTASKLAADPSIPTITITAKRLTEAEKIQWAKEDADSAVRAMAADRTPVKTSLPAGASAPAMTSHRS